MTRKLFSFPLSSDCIAKKLRVNVVSHAMFAYEIKMLKSKAVKEMMFEECRRFHVNFLLFLLTARPSPAASRFLRALSCYLFSFAPKLRN